MKLINLTPHAVNVIDDSGEEIACFPKCLSPLPRLKQETVLLSEQDGIRITETQFGEIENLPEPKEGIRLIVSRLVIAACPDRNDLVVPNEVVRDNEGRIIGCKSFSIN